MALLKADHQLEQVTFSFDEAGEVVDVLVEVNYAIQDDATNQQLTRVREAVSILDKLPPGIGTAAANEFGKRCRQLAEEV